jgi:hypothetical protein
VALEVEEWDERQRRNCILKVKCHGAVIIFVFELSPSPRPSQTESCLAKEELFTSLAPPLPLSPHPPRPRDLLHQQLVVVAVFGSLSNILSPLHFLVLLPS